MLPDYADIRGRIPEEPTWFDVHGVPRYGEPPAGLLPFIRGVKCQCCGEEFRVCLIGEVYHGLYDRRLEVRLGEPCPLNANERHAEVVDQPMKHWEPRGWADVPLPEDWHYGDPPRHGGCVGETMNSVPDYDWEEWEC